MKKTGSRQVSAQRQDRSSTLKRERGGGGGEAVAGGERGRDSVSSFN